MTPTKNFFLSVFMEMNHVDNDMTFSFVDLTRLLIDMGFRAEQAVRLVDMLFEDAVSDDTNVPGMAIIVPERVVCVTFDELTYYFEN